MSTFIELFLAINDVAMGSKCSPSRDRKDVLFWIFVNFLPKAKYCGIVYSEDYIFDPLPWTFTRTRWKIVAFVLIHAAVGYTKIAAFAGSANVQI